MSCTLHKPNILNVKNNLMHNHERIQINNDICCDILGNLEEQNVIQ